MKRDPDVVLESLRRDLASAATRLYDEGSEAGKQLRSPPRRPVRRVTIAVAVSAAAVASVVAFVVGAGSDPRATAGGAAETSFSIFDRPATPSTVATLPLPASTTSRVPRNDPHLVEVAQHRVWLTRGAEKYCVGLQPGPDEPLAMACGDATDARGTGLFVTTSAPPDRPDPVWRLAALIPDGVSRVTIELADGTQDVSTVTTNVIVEESSAAPVRARFTDAGGHEHVQRLSDS